ncbi:hypothetical protein [Actinomadura flavalba]|uniref:hypothetical protein n=1 Tax=Actinomadura flavalba TaxID=1120938 RepID=UPI0012DED8CE|nr:hypothetical protein [Actinomadura flavalba]
MRLRTAARAGLITGAAGPILFGLASAALADDLDIDPSSARHGQTVTVSGGCQAGDRYVNISGAVNAQGAVNDGWFSVQGKVTASASGRHKITAKCITSNYSQDGTIRVTGGKKEGGNQPHGWAETGGGGTQGPDVPWTPVGVTLAAGAFALGSVALLRSRSRGRA